MSNNILDPLPLGVSGLLTIPHRQYASLVGRGPKQDEFLFSDQERISYVALRLAEAFDRPLTAPGSEGVASLAMEYFDFATVMIPFSEKGLQTLRDGHYHSTAVLSPQKPHMAITFIAWSGTHREVQPQRVGNYIGPLFSSARRIVEMVEKQLVGYLEIDAYLRDNPDPENPGLPLQEVFQVDVEYSYVPGLLLGCSVETSNDLSKMVILNPDLCSPEERQALKKIL